MNFGKFCVQVIVVFLLLLILGAVLKDPPAVLLPNFFLAVVVLEFIAWIILIALLGFFLAKSIDKIKGPFAVIAFTILAAILLGLVLALFCYLNITSAPRLNLEWLENGEHWYDSWIAVLIIGAVLLLPFYSAS